MAQLKQSFIYNSSAVSPNVENPFNIDKPTLIKAAGLTVDVPIYFSAGICYNCGPNDILWEPLTVCGQTLTIGPTNNHVVISIPGKYRLGPPTPVLTLAGDVNITKQENVAQWQLPKICPEEVVEEPCEPLERGLQVSW